MSNCINNFNNIDLKNTIKDTLNNLNNYATLNSNPNSNLYYKPDDDLNTLFTNGFTSNFSNINTDLTTIEGKNNLINIDYNTSNIYQNCVIKTSNPWFTISSNNNKCEVIKNIELDDKLRYSTDRQSLKTNFKSSDPIKSAYCSHYSNLNIAYCENRWYDWIIVPNYYLGNTYFKDNSKYGENDVYKCYKPCNGDYLPYKTQKGEMKCIPKKYFSSGVYADKYIYNALGLINLIGNIAMKDTPTEKKSPTKNLIYILFYLIFKHKHSNSIDTNIYTINDNLLNHISNFTNMQPEMNKIFNEFKKAIDDNILTPFTTSINQDYLYESIDFTYKHVNFNENESNMFSLNGLFANNLLTPPILIHTWILANLFQPLNEDILNGWKTNATDIYSKYDPKKETEKQQNIIGEFLYEKLYQVFKKDNKPYEKALRLKNIFFKAVNICYNNKTNFSANIILKTKDALEQEQSGLVKIIKDMKFYINSSTENSFIKNNLDNILNSSKLDDFKEFKFYTDNDIDILALNYTTNDFINKKILQNIYNDNNPNKFKYLFSMESLERGSCTKGTKYNSTTKQCEKIITTEPTIETNNDIDSFDKVFQIPKFNNILLTFFQIILTIIILYIFYIFYDMFGETILSIYNWITVTWEDYKYIKEKTKLNDRKFNDIDNDNNNDNDIDITKQQIAKEIKYLDKKYMRIDRKAQLIKNYILENKKTKI